jgi:hypothetical protein
MRNGAVTYEGLTWRKGGLGWVMTEIRGAEVCAEFAYRAVLDIAPPDARGLRSDSLA